MAPKQKVLMQKFTGWFESAFGGGGNPEVHDAWEACAEPSHTCLALTFLH